MLKNTLFNYKIKIETKLTTTTAINCDLKYSPVSEGSTCIAEPTHKIIQ